MPPIVHDQFSFERTRSYPWARRERESYCEAGMVGIRPQTLLAGSSIVRWRSEARDGRRSTTGRPEKGGDTRKGKRGYTVDVRLDSQNLK
jgi:hypothetical protein